MLTNNAFILNYINFFKFFKLYKTSFEVEIFIGELEGIYRTNINLKCIKQLLCILNFYYDNTSVIFTFIKIKNNSK
jgi:hypothetical protein